MSRLPIAEHAIVMGGSMAGLLAGRVLADRFERVTIVERDRIDATEPIARKGVPQGRHVHNLLARGDAVLDGLFPELFRTLEARGAVHVDWSRDTRWHHHGVWKGRFDSGVESWLMSRPLLEWCVRELIQADPHIDLRTGVRAITPEMDGGRVTGLALDDGSRLEADLVLDCTGRGTKTPQWLAEAGFGDVATSTIRCDVVYATREMRPRSPPPYKVLAQVAPPPGKRSAVAFAIEGDRWMVTLFGYHGEHPPSDDAGWRAFSRSLPEDEMARLVEDADALTDVTRYHFETTTWRRYERLARRPAGLVVLGDAVCSFNPIYGQGMTSAALQAEALRETLSACTSTEDIRRVEHSLPAKFAKVVNECWQAVASEDFRHAETRGDRHPAAAFINWYTRRLHRLAAHDPIVVTKFLRVMHMQAPVSSLFDPITAAKVVFASS